MPIIDIHEFSTGIHVRGTPDHWWSEGFTGNYINNTIDPIPEAVTQYIGQRYFHLSESARQQTPGIIGREVKSGHEEWSVIAVISNKTDESGRIIEGTRYFLTQGLGKIEDLITYQQQQKLIFDPFDLQTLNQPHQYNTAETVRSNLLNNNVFYNYQQLIQQLSNTPLLPSGTITTSGQRIPIKAIHQLAEERARQFRAGRQSSEEQGELILDFVSWAYNVGGLKRPQDFHVIYPTASTISQSANSSALRALPPASNGSATSSVLLSSADADVQQSLQHNFQRRPTVQGQDEISTIIRNWINNLSVADNDLETIGWAYSQPQIYTPEFWQESIFEELGINDSDDSNQIPDYIAALDTCHFLSLPDVDVTGQNIGIDRLIQQQVNSQPYQIFKQLSQAIQQKIIEDYPTSPNRKHIEQIIKRARKGIQKIIAESSGQSGLSGAKLSSSGNLETFYSVLTIFNVRRQNAEIRWLLTEENGIWTKNYKPYGEQLRQDGERYKTQLWDDIQQIARNYLQAKQALLQQYQGTGLNIGAAQNQINDFLRRDYQLAHADANLRLLNTPCLNNLKEYFIELIWYQQGDTQNATLEDNTKSLFQDLAKVFEAIFEDKKQNQQSANIDTDYKLQALINQILHGNVPISLWRKLGCKIRWGEKDKIKISLSDRKATIIILKRKLIPGERYLLPLLILLVISFIFSLGFGAAYLYFLPQLSKSNQTEELILMANLDLPDGLEKLVSDLAIYGDKPIPKLKSKQAIIEIFELQNPLESGEAIDWKGLIKEYHNKKELQPPDVVKMKQGGNTRNSLIDDIKKYVDDTSKKEQQNKGDKPKDNSTHPKKQFKDKTIPAIDKIVEDIYAIATKQDPIKTKENVQQKLIEIIENSDNKRGLSFENISKNKQSEKWREAIKEYQDKSTKIKIEPTGIIQEGSDTDKILRCELREKLEVKSKENKIKECQKYGIKLIPEDKSDPPETPETKTETPTPPVETADRWKTTVQTFDTLRDEFIGLGVSKDQAEIAITVNVYAAAAYQYIQGNKTDWIAKIKVFQRDNGLIETGYITPNDDTYNTLRCKMAEYLSLTENEKFSECNVNSDNVEFENLDRGG